MNSKYFLSLLAALVITILLCALVTESFSQTPPYGWMTQSSGTNNNLNAVYMINDNTGIIVGHAGTILKTTDGGASWVSKNSNTFFDLYAVYFTSSNTGFASGDGGVVLKTTNGGNSWSTINTGINASVLNGIYFVSSSTGIISGWYGIIMRTTNGGNSWTQISSGTNINLMGLGFKNANTGLIVGLSGKTLRTTNGGASWSSVTSGTSSDLFAVFVVSNDKGLSAGELGAMRKSTNAGSSWSSQSSGTSRWLSGIHFVDMNTGTIVGDNGTIRRSSDNGANFKNQVSNTSDWLRGVHFTSITHGVVVGDFGTIRRTTTGGWLLPTQPGQTAPGNNSTCQSLTVRLDWNSVPDPIAFYRVQLSLSSNFSTTLIDVNNINDTYYDVPNGTLALNTKYYWRVMATNEVGTGQWSSTRNFTTLVPSPGNTALTAPANNATNITLTPLLDWNTAQNSIEYQLQLADDSTFSNIVLSTDTISGTSYPVPPGMLDNSTTYYWRVRGRSLCESGEWSPVWHFRTAVELPSAPVLVSPPSGTLGLNLVFDTDWLDIASAESFRIEISSDSSFASPELDSAGLLASNFTIPAGLLSHSTWYYWRVRAKNEAGEGPYSPVWNFQTSIVTGLNVNTSIIPDRFGLMQNYPNPFNPSTSISFDLPERSDVNLTVYNTLGQSVAVLVNSSLQAGRYNYVFDASSVPSGIYFYRIKAGEFVETKRMVLIK
ncbi:MAG: T9SS type A sorting domain-containing protein [Ignavibacteriae bacterium]|nr:T9SS type A sorting domain-containing protein [Ignavibacteriota bacterium]MCB9242313.1 T9SS type A sorting domain-containing protein [Ignavibacteriales bacterium]